MKKIFLLFTFFFFKSVFSNYDSNIGQKDKFISESKKQFKTKLKFDDAEYIKFSKTTKFLLKKVIKDMLPHYGIVTADKKEFLPTVFSEYIEFSNGTYILANNTEAILLSNDFKVFNSWSGRIYTLKQENFFSIQKQNSYQTLDLFDYNGNSLLAKIKNGDLNPDEYLLVMETSVDNQARNLVIVSKGLTSVDNKSALYDMKTQKYLTPFKYKTITTFHNGFLCFTKEHLVGEADFVDYTGKVIKSFPYLRTVWNDILVVKNEQNMWAVLDQNLKNLTPYEYDELIEHKSPLTAILRKGKEYYAFSEGGKSKFNIGYDYLFDLSDNKFIVEKNGKFGILEAPSKEIYPITYDSIFRKGNYIYCLKNNKWTILDFYVRKVIVDQIDDWRDLGAGVYGFKKGALWAFYHGQNEQFSEFSYTKIKSIEASSSSYLLKINQKCGLTKADGKLKTEIEFDYINLIPGTSYYIASKGGKCGIIQFSSVYKIIVPFEYDYIGLESNGYDIDYTIHALNRQTGEIKISKLP